MLAAPQTSLDLTVLLRVCVCPGMKLPTPDDKKALRTIATKLRKTRLHSNVLTDAQKYHLKQKLAAAGQLVLDVAAEITLAEVELPVSEGEEMAVDGLLDELPLSELLEHLPHADLQHVPLDLELSSTQT